jgi:hypothetical protein
MVLLGHHFLSYLTVLFVASSKDLKAWRKLKRFVNILRMMKLCPENRFKLRVCMCELVGVRKSFFVSFDLRTFSSSS